MALALVRPEILCAWNGPSLLVVNTRGECGTDQVIAGFYFREARFLNTLALQVNGVPPWACEAAAVNPATLAFNFVHPEISEPGGGGSGQSDDEERTDAKGLPERALDLRLAFRVGVAELTLVLAVGNRARRPLRFELAWQLGADYADIQEALARVEVPGNRVIEEVIARNVRDVASLPLLEGEPDEWLALQAGVPLYPAFFGRDAVTAGWQAGWVDGGEALAPR